MSIPPNNAPREYTTHIDFSRTVNNWPLRGQLFVYVHKSDLVTYLGKLLAANVLDSFSMKIGNTYTPTSVLVKFECVSAIGHRVDDGIAKLLAISGEFSVHITWWEGVYTYRISPAGRVYTKNRVEEGGC